MFVWAIGLFPCRYLPYNLAAVGRRGPSAPALVSAGQSERPSAQRSLAEEETEDPQQDDGTPHRHQHGRRAEAVLVERTDP